MRKRDRHADDFVPVPGHLDPDGVPPVPDPDATGDTAAPPVEAAADQRSDLDDVMGNSGPALAESLEGELAQQRDRFLRLAAEYDNYRRRVSRERAEAEMRGQAELVSQLLDALDDLARFAHLDPDTTDALTVVQGADLVERKLLKALTAAGLEIVNPIDEPFDPARQEAVTTVPAVAPEDDHTVSQVYQPGYVFKGQLLRPARVVVRQWTG